MQVVRYESRQEPGDPFDVPIHQDIIFTAIGGNGEDGQDGGDGQRGKDGIDGTPATRVEDARVGST